MRKNSFLFIVSLGFSQAVMAQQSPTPLVVDTIQVARDSASQQQDWSIRTPLTPEELEKRADNRARVEEMKQRFRDFHQTSEQERSNTAQEAEDADYLWSDAEQGGQIPVQQEENLSKPEEDDALRMEIGRNLQLGKKGDSSPSSPVLPSYPESSTPVPSDYGAVPNPPVVPATPTAISSEINSAFQSDQSTNQAIGETEAWQTKVGVVSNTNGENTSPASKLVAGASYRLEGVSFIPLHYTLNSNSYPALDAWAYKLIQDPGLILEVRAFTHSELDQLSANELSIQRAKTIVDYLLAKGVGQQQLSYRGYGSLSPLVPTSDPQAKQKNERIELIILELTNR